MSHYSCVHYLVVAGCIGVTGIVCGFVIPVPDIVAVIVPVPLIVDGGVMVVVPVFIVVVVFIVVEDIVCPPFVLPPMANTWVARASAAITATVVNFFIWIIPPWVGCF
jgi:hypothetical protein